MPAVADTTVGWRFINPRMNKEWTISLGMTAEKVARRYGITREAQDAFAAESQRRAACAIADGVFNDEIVPVTDRARPRRPASSSTPTNIRVRTSRRRRSPALKPAFTTDRRHRHGRQLQRHQRRRLGAARGRRRTRAGSRPTRSRCARIVTTAVAGVDPSVMGIGPVPATRKALERAGLTIDQIDLIELNEAFAAQGLACMKELEHGSGKVNVYGGAIALGHALGSSGSRMLTTLVHALHRQNKRYGLVTMCIGVGQGIAMIVERK